MLSKPSENIIDQQKQASLIRQNCIETFEFIAKTDSIEAL